MASMTRKRLMRELGGLDMLGFLERFPDEAACEEELMRDRFPKGWACPKCGNRACSPVAGRGHKRQCTRCSHQFSLTAGTAMHATHLPLRKWFLACWLASTSKRGISALELAKQIGVSERTAGYVLRRLRGAMAAENEKRVLRGEVELDDAHVGAKPDNCGPGRGCGRQPVVVAVEAGSATRRGRMVVRAVPNCSGPVYRGFAEEHVAKDAHVRSDDWNGITAGLKGWENLDQRAFDGADGERSLPLVHRAISNLKAFAQGTYHGLPKERLQSFLDEYAWRYSNRDMGGVGIARRLIAAACSGRRTRSELKRDAFPMQAPSLFTREELGQAGGSARWEIGMYGLVGA